jgi:hypothetical protein
VTAASAASSETKGDAGARNDFRSATAWGVADKGHILRNGAGRGAAGATKSARLWPTRKGFCRNARCPNATIALLTASGSGAISFAITTKSVALAE